MDDQNSKDYTLSIRLTPDGFSFSIHNVNADHSFHYEKILFGAGSDYQAMLEEAILEHELLLYPYKQIHIIVASPRFTFVPKPFYKEEFKKDFYQFNISSKNERLLTDQPEQTDMVTIYGIDKEVYAFLCRTFTNPSFHHHLSILTEYFSAKSKLGNTDKMICQVRDHTLDILCFRKGKLLLANSYHYRHCNDAVYYILYTWQQVKFDSSNDSLQFTGDSETVHELSTLLNPYIAGISPVVFPTQMFNLGNESLLAPFDLIALPLCV